MAISRGPKTTTNGLVFCVDAADKNSYIGSGTTWSDVSGNGNTGILLALHLGMEVNLHFLILR